MGLGSILGSIGAAAAAPFTAGTSLALLPLLPAGGALADKLFSGNQAGNLSQVFGNAAGGANDARFNQGQLNVLQNRNVLDQFQIQQQAMQVLAQLKQQGLISASQLQLAQRQFSEQATQNRAALNATIPGQRLPTGLKGALAANTQDVTPRTLPAGTAHPRANVVDFQGGLRPSALGASGRALGAQAASNALAGSRTRAQQGQSEFATGVPQIGEGLDPLSLPNLDSTILAPPNQLPIPQGSTAANALGGAGLTAGILQALFGGAQQPNGGILNTFSPAAQGITGLPGVAPQPIPSLADLLAGNQSTPGFTGNVTPPTF